MKGHHHMKGKGIKGFQGVEVGSVKKLTAGVAKAYGGPGHIKGLGKEGMMGKKGMKGRKLVDIY